MAAWHSSLAPHQSPNPRTISVGRTQHTLQRHVIGTMNCSPTMYRFLSITASGVACTSGQPERDVATLQCLDRVRCPFDPTHDCKASEVEQHLRKCPSRKQNRRRNQKAYIQPDCNMSAVALDQSTNEPAKPAPLNTTESRTAYAAAIGDERLRQLVNKMRSIAQKINISKPLRVSAFCPDSCRSQLDPVAEHQASIPMNPKHATQHASIIGNLEQLGLMEDPEQTTFVDLGAGKGFMSLMLVRATPARNLILNDNRTFRLKADRILRRMAKEKTKHVQFLRCRADLKDFSIGGALAELQDMASKTQSVTTQEFDRVYVPKQVVGIGKHLCGVATDWALKSLFNQSGFVLKGFCLAPCCHQRCQWDEYVGQDELMKLGLRQREVELMFWMGRWAFCGHEAAEAPDNSDGDPSHVGDNVEGACHEATQLSRKEKVEAGLLSKVLLDYGRLAWIREQSHSLNIGDLVTYVDKSISGENRLLAVSLDGSE